MNTAFFLDAISPWLSDDDGPVRARLTLAIRQAIGAGRLPQGYRFPAERILARALNVSRPTVSGVIDDLRSSALVTSRQGSGTWVEGAGPVLGPPIPFVEMIQAAGLIDLASATAPDASFLPAMRVETTDLLLAEPANGLSPMGLWSLREAIARRAARFVPDTTGENVIITSGAHQALALVVAALAGRGSSVLVEETTYGGLVDMIRANGCRPVGISRDSDGVVPSVLEKLLGQHKPSLIILVSPVHSPSGTISSPQRCDDLAQVLASSDAQVVLDETYADLEFAPSGRPLSTRLGEQAIRIGSLSKTLWTGLRTGWIISDSNTVTSIVRRRWQQFDLGPSVASQLFALRSLEGIDDRLVRRCGSLRNRAEWMNEALTAASGDWDPAPVHGGLAMWVGLAVDGGVFANEAARRGVAVLPGSACRADNADTPHVRICFDRPIDVLQAALERLTD
ncbi:MAG: PLP-dependent aminotransferase family protein [Acidimicrobiales bacterium]